MKISGVGIDIEEIKKFSIFLKNERFCKKIFTEEELNKSSKYKNKKIVYLARYFSLKEAFLKAIGIGFTQGLLLNNIEVKEDKGILNLLISGKARHIMKKTKTKKINAVSSCTDKFVISLVILER